MKSIRIASIVLMMGFAYAGFNHARTTACGSTCTTSHDKFESFVTINGLMAEGEHVQDTDDDDTTTQTYTFTGHEVSLRGERFPLFCSGKDLKRKDIAGVCMDGNFLWYTSDDCSRNCKCDNNGMIHCDIPSDCGPQKDVIQYCVSNPAFGCTCLTNKRDTQAFEMRQQSDTTQLSSMVTITKIRVTNLDAIKVVADASENTATITEQAEDKGVPEVPICWFWWYCERPPGKPPTSTPTAVTIATD